MRKLYKRHLDFDLAYKFTYDSLNDVNQLSTELLKVVDFKSGHFFTLLPGDANIARLHEFKTGLILPQFSEESHYVNGKKCTYTQIPNIYDEIADEIHNRMKAKKLFCIFDDVTSYPEDENIAELFKAHGLAFKKEVYYLIDNDVVSHRLILDCLHQSKSFWHSLCVFVQNPLLHHIEKDLNLELIEKLCANTVQLLVEAYDGEGYIFWEKNQEGGG